MKLYLRYLRSDLIKLRRQPLLWIHLVIPLVGIAVFLSYYAFSPWTSQSKVEAYLQIVAISLPVMIGIVCAFAADQEANAGNYQVLLTSSVKPLPFVSKISLLLLLGLGSIMLAAAGFGFGYIFILDSTLYDLTFYVCAGGILFIGSIFMYILHFIISLRYGRGASMGLGIVESMVAALLLTGLGDFNWIYVPCAWSARWITIWAQYPYARLQEIPPEMLLNRGLIHVIVGTAIIAILFSVWLYRWEGKRSLE
ncbi:MULTISPECIES: lantibiotic immunity ABC transporter MutG family permease subunit [Paenibacillus]|uniref:lantibiotic immunity ABC transporter MutG family permease subunit n=1 Tax=Paenibacillus TaxID=44249 RepID=UPI002FE0306D